LWFEGGEGFKSSRNLSLEPHRFAVAQLPHTVHFARGSPPA